jgi:hypothetical protein
LVEPRITTTGEIYAEVQVDEIYLSSKWCCLIAWAHGRVIAWQWCDREKTASWKALLDTRVQRCLVHVQRNVRIYLTTKPRTDAGKALWALGRSLTKITTADEAVTWLQHLNDWHALFGHLLRERTYRKSAGGRAVPTWVRPGQQWWYTHERLRKAYRLLAKLVERDELFTYLAPEHAALQISSTTNRIEGGVNAGLREPSSGGSTPTPSPHHRPPL